MIAAGPAFAGADGECLWSNLTPQTRDGLMTAYRTSGERAFGQVRPSAEDQQSLSAACGLNAQNMLDSFEALKLATIEHGAAAALQAERGLDQARLEAAWAGMAAADRAAILKAAVGAVEGDEDDGSADAAITRFMTGLGLPMQTQGPNQGFYWLRAHAMGLAYKQRA
jgi:hypothetical protein